MSVLLGYRKLNHTLCIMYHSTQHTTVPYMSVLLGYHKLNHTLCIMYHSTQHTTVPYMSVLLGYHKLNHTLCIMYYTKQHTTVPYKLCLSCWASVRRLCFLFNCALNIILLLKTVSCPFQTSHS